MSKQSIIIQGSSRSDGDTNAIVKQLLELTEAGFIDLKTKDIHAYDYEYKHLDDDFIPTIETILEYDILIFATPVYWYSMSGIMKDFFDRITDLLKQRKDLGYQLRGKTMMVISCSSEEYLVPEFIAAFRYSAEYLGMQFDSHLHGWIEDGGIPQKVQEGIQLLADKLNAATRPDIS
jgi:multimeric flavodoxin WrbA